MRKLMITKISILLLLISFGVAVSQNPTGTGTVTSSGVAPATTTTSTGNAAGTTVASPTGVNVPSELMQNFNQSASDLNRADQPLNGTGSLTFSNGNLLNTNLINNNAVIVDQFGNPVIIANPDANPFNTGIVLNPNFNGGSLPVTGGGFPLGSSVATNPNIALTSNMQGTSVVGFEGSSLAGVSGGSFPVTSEFFPLGNGTHFAPLTLGSTSGAIITDTITSVDISTLTGPSSGTVGRTARQAGIFQRNDGTFTNVRSTRSGS
jgi:hypothetical protein